MLLFFNIANIKYNTFHDAGTSVQYLSNERFSSAYSTSLLFFVERELLTLQVAPQTGKQVEVKEGQVWGISHVEKILESALTKGSF